MANNKPRRISNINRIGISKLKKKKNQTKNINNRGHMLHPQSSQVYGTHSALEVIITVKRPSNLL